MNFPKTIKRSLVLMLVASVFMAPLLAVPVRSAKSAESKAESALSFMKNIYTLEYLDGNNGKYRNASLFNKIVRQPGRAITTAVVYGFSLWSLKLLYDVAEKQGVFESIKTHVARQTQERQQQAYQDRQRQRHEMEMRQQRPLNQRPLNQRPLNQRPDGGIDNVSGNQNPAQTHNANPVRINNNVHIANPLPGRQLHVNGIPNLPGFYHMRSHTPYHGIPRSCGLHSTYNMAQVEARTLGRQMNDNAFDQIARAVFPGLNMPRGGASNDNVARMAHRLGLAPVVVLGFNENDEIQRVGREVHVRHANQFGEALVAAADEDANRAVQELRDAPGAHVAHFLCGVPGHWIAISVVKNADGAQAMYLHDNLNEQPVAIDHMRLHIENIYNRFFN